MCRELLVAKEQDGIWTILQRMRTKGIRRMPVVNEQDSLEGIITADDLLELLAEELNLLAKVHLRGQKQERETRA
jgi:predicted transcriptional regulator